MCARSPVAPQISHLWLKRIGHRILSPLRRTCARYTWGLSPESKSLLFSQYLLPISKNHLLISSPLFKQNPQCVCVCLFGNLETATNGSIPTLRFSSSYLEGPMRYDDSARNKPDLLAPSKCMNNHSHFQSIASFSSHFYASSAPSSWEVSIFSKNSCPCLPRRERVRRDFCKNTFTCQWSGVLLKVGHDCTFPALKRLGKLWLQRGRT